LDRGRVKKVMEKNYVPGPVKGDNYVSNLKIKGVLKLVIWIWFEGGKT